MGQPALAREDERALAQACRAGDARARDGLVRSSLPFVVTIALEYRRWGVPIEDLVQQGSIGLLKATEKFDPDRDVRFSTYASYWVRAEIRDYVMRAYRLVRVGTTKRERRAIRSFRVSPTDDPAVLAERSGLTPERSAELLPVLRGREASFDAAGMDETFAPAHDNPEQVVDELEAHTRARDAIPRALARLSEREQMIVRARAFSEDEPLSLSTLSVKLGITKERVRQIEQRAWEKLRADLAPLRADLQP